MAAYSDDPTSVCSQTFDDAALQSSFPGSTEARQSRVLCSYHAKHLTGLTDRITTRPTKTAWQIIQQFGPTASGAQGFSVVVPGTSLVLVGGTEGGLPPFFEGGFPAFPNLSSRGEQSLNTHRMHYYRDGQDCRRLQGSVRLGIDLVRGRHGVESSFVRNALLTGRLCSGM